jgi:hypothetical protein
MFLLSESLCAWILLLWILSDVTQGSILFGAGFCLVIFGWAVVGMIIEAYGFILLFRYVILSSSHLQILEPHFDHSSQCHIGVPFCVHPPLGADEVGGES